MKCFTTGWAALLDVSLWVNWATIAAPIIAGLAIGIALYQLKESRKESRRSSAYAIYTDYLQLCFDHQKYSCGFTIESSSDEDELNQYRWFITRMLFAFEQILDVYSDDEEWVTTIKSQLKRHEWHLSNSGTIRRGEWSADLTSLVNDLTTTATATTQ